MAFNLFQDNKKNLEDPNLPEKVLEVAHSRAEKIIERALKKSEEILHEMDEFRDQMKKEMKGVFKQSADSFVHAITEESNHFSEECNQLFPEIRAKYMEGVEKSIQSFKVELAKELVPVRQIVDQKVIETTTLLRTKIEEEWAMAKKEIEEYKQQRKAKIESELEGKLDQLARESFAKALTATQHHQLVMSALEKAKKEGVFGT